MRVKMNPERVRSLREEKGMSRKGLAEAAGISPRTAARAERGELVQGSTATAVAAVFSEGPSESLERVVRG